MSPWTTARQFWPFAASAVSLGPEHRRRLDPRRPLLLTRTLESQLHEVGSRDPLTFALAPLVLLGVALVACPVTMGEALARALGSPPSAAPATRRQTPRP